MTQFVSQFLFGSERNSLGSISRAIAYFTLAKAYARNTLAELHTEALSDS